jgi:acetolactate synthase-1/2/3 large subunit
VTTTKLSDYVIDFIAATGVKHVFLLPGGGCMHLVDSLGSSKDLTFVANLHEQACAVAADAYAQYTNNLGVALVTTGPGGTNTITGVAAAWNDSIPCLFLSGQVKRADLMTGRGVRQMGPQEVDIVSLVKPITKYAATITDPSTVRLHLEKALYLAKSGRPGPVWLDFPLDVQAAMIDPESLPRFTPAPEPVIDVETPVREALRHLATAKRPVILAGNGVRLAGALEPFRELIERLRVPVLTTWKSMDFLPDDHPLFAGRPGGVGQRAANFAQQNSDWILVIGARLDLPQIAFNPANFARAAKRVIVDIDESEIRKLDWEDAIEIVADARVVIDELLRQTEGSVDVMDWIAQCQEWRRRYPIVLDSYREETDGVNNYVLVDVLADEMSADDLMVPGSSGACSEITMQSFRVRKGMRVFNTEGLGPMGFGIPATIGACLASGRRHTVSIDGDGGFHMNNQELETVRRLNLPIKYFVLDNDGYASIRATQRNYFDSRFVASSPDSGLTLPDTLRIAAAYGLATFEILDQSRIHEQVREVLEHSGPAVCRVKITPSQMTAPRAASRQLADGSMVSAPMEDLWPFLDREEFERNMLIGTLPGQ